MENTIIEKGIGQENLNLVQKVEVLEKGFEKAVWKIKRWASATDQKAKKIYSKAKALKLFGAPQVTKIKGNLLLNSGINELWTVVCSGSGVEFDATNSQLGVGDSAVAEAATQTALQAVTNVLYKGMLAGFPTYGTLQKATWKSEFLGTEANYAWNEFAVRNGATALKLLNRKVSAQGTKTAGQLWETTLEIVLS